MVKVKIIRADNSWEEGYVGGIYNAFQMEFNDRIEYAAHVDKDKILGLKPEQVEVVKEKIPALKVKIITAEDYWQEPYVGGIYEAFRMEYYDGINYCVHVANDMLPGFKPEQVEVIEEEILTTEEQTSEPTRKILLVEDGSVNEDDLEEWCKQNGIKLIVYRQGANKPEFLTY